VAFFFFQVGVYAQVKQTKRVLILNDLGIVASPGFAEIDNAVLDRLQKSPYQIELYHESLEITLFPDEASQRDFRAQIIRKYSHRKPDVIIAAGSASLKFVAESSEDFLGQVPTIFCTTLEEIPEPPNSGRHFTGVQGQLHPQETLDVALRMLPGTKHVVVTGGMSKFDQDFEALAKQAFRAYESKIEFTYLTDLTMPALLERLRHLPADTIVYHTAITQDAAGNRFVDASQSVPLVVGAANAPVFVMDDVDFKAGGVGGDLVNWEDDARVAADLAVRVLNGEKPQDIPFARSADAYMFDWRSMRRWGLKESALPRGSIILNRPPDFWQLYKRYISLGVLVILIQMAVILALLRQRAMRKKTEAELLHANEQLRVAMELGNGVGWELDVPTGQNYWFGNLKTMFGLSSNQTRVQLGDFFKFVHPEDRQRVSDAVNKAKKDRAIYNQEFRIVKRDGTTSCVVSRGEFDYDKKGEAKRVRGMAIDITERKLAEEALRESEERFRLIANATPVMIWMAGTDRLCTYCNQTWLNFTGRSIEQDLGNGWMDSIHPEDRTVCFNTYTNAYDRRELFEMEYRLRRHDGEYRWVFDQGVPRFHQDGSFAGYIGSVYDVTERKLAEEALSSVSRRLIEAHEEERTWIARELHDDFNQRIALLKLNLDSLKQDLPASAGATRQGIEELCEVVSRLGSDVQALSHRLHSSKLEYLGLESAASGFCKELSQQQGVEITFRSKDIPKKLPQEVSLCLFRVLQEALQNGVKHSGTRQFEVCLEGALNEVNLTVHDSGVGFDLEGALKGHGLGLTSMKERVKLVEGQFSIASQPNHGTTVRATIPLGPSSKSDQASA
jgi:PAS domain S-box-containing protein